MNNEKDTKKVESTFRSKAKRVLILFAVEIVLGILIFIIIQVFNGA